MFKKIKEMKKQNPKKELSVGDKRKRAIIILSCYLVFFGILFFLIFTNRDSNTNNNAYEVLNDVKNPINKRFNNFVYENNYKYEFYISSNLVLKGEKENVEEHGIKTYNGIETEYYINNNNYYLKQNNNYNKVDTLNLFEEYDETLLTNESIEEILRNAEITNKTKNEETTEEEFEILLNDVLKIYNEINLTEFEANENEKLKGTFTTDKDSLTINIDMSSFYKTVYKNDILIQYNLKFYDKDKVNIDINLKGDTNEE